MSSIPPRRLLNKTDDYLSTVARVRQTGDRPFLFSLSAKEHDKGTVLFTVVRG